MKKLLLFFVAISSSLLTYGYSKNSKAAYRDVLTANDDVSNDNKRGAIVKIPLLANDKLANGSTPRPEDVAVDLVPDEPGIQSSFPTFGGRWDYDALTGNVTFTPSAPIGLDPAPVKYFLGYTLIDSDGGVAEYAEVTLTYKVGPGAYDDFSYNNVAGAAVQVNILDNDVSITGGPLRSFLYPYTVTIQSGSGSGGNYLYVPGEGTWQSFWVNVVVFEPLPGFKGNPTPIRYTLSETDANISDEATITIKYLSEPEALAKTKTIPTPALGYVLPLDGQNGNPEPLSGTDPGDGELGTGAIFVINNIDGLNGNKLVYNNAPIASVPFTISDYDPSQLAIEFTGRNSDVLRFSYHVVDTDGLSSPVAAVYELSWENPLPVKLMRFTAKAEGGQVMLDWVTAEETNSDYFEIQRSNNGTVWQPVDQLRAAGQASTVQRYTFTDEYPFAGQNLYRLKMVDSDNTFAFSSIQTVRVAGTAKVNMYPNPVSNGLTIDIPCRENVASVDVFDQTGIKRASQHLLAPSKLDMSKYEPGIYLVIVKYRDGNSDVQRVLVRH